jgi:hypothetical protein
MGTASRFTGATGGGGEVNRRVVTASVALAIVVFLVAAGVHLAGGVVRRPEGAAERFLQRASRQSAKDRAGATTYGPAALATSLIQFTRKKTDDDFLRRIEVGRATRDETGEVARVPARTVRNDVAKTVERFTLLVVRQPGAAPRGWKVSARVARAPGEAVPSEGGAEPASAPLTTWLLALGVGVLITVGSELLLRRIGARPHARRRATPSG